MGEIGKVISVDGNKVKVALERTEACAKCKACTAGFSKEEMIIEAKNDCSAQEGDFVNIELSSKNFILAVLIMYGVPLISLIIGFILGGILFDSIYLPISKDMTSFFSGIIFMIISYGLIKINNNSFKTDEFSPSATKKVD